MDGLGVVVCGLLAGLGLTSADARAKAPAAVPGAMDAGARPAPAARAEPPGPALDLGVGSVVPLYLGAQAQVEGPYRLLAGVEFGWMPKGYAYGIDSMLKSFGVYPDEVSQLIREALQSSVVIRPSIGWRPFSSLGLETTVGYTYLSLGGGLGARQVIETVTGRQLPNEAANQIPLHSTLHNVHAQVAYRFVFGEHFVLRPSVGFLHCFASSSGIDAQARTAAGRRAVSQVNAAIDDYLGGYYVDYVYAPLVGVTAAYRL